MRQIILIFAFCCQFQLYAQYSIWQDYDFNQGGYTLLYFSSPDISYHYNNCFYSDDRTLLYDYQKAFSNLSDADIYRYACFTDDMIMLCKEGFTLERILYSLNCHSITVNDICYKFGGWVFSGVPLKKTRHESTSFTSREKAIQYVDSISNNPLLVYTERPDWMDFEGEFSFIYKDKKFDTDKMAVELTDQISGAYPGSSFKITWIQSLSGSSDTGFHYFVYVNSNKDLYDQFKLYNKTAIGWQYFPLILHSYWRQ